MPAHRPFRASVTTTHGRGLVLLGAVLWGTAGATVSLGPDDAAVWQVAAIRLVVGAAGLIALAALTGRLGGCRGLIAPP